MSLFDFLKRKKEVEKAKKAKEGGKKPDKKPQEVFPVKQEKEFFAKKSTVFSYNNVREPHISEKAAYLAEKNQYVFKVFPNCNKKEIKKAVEGVYGVNVLSVNMIKIPAKKRRLGRIQGYKKGHIKAIVKIKEGQKIEIL
ncbi:MAG: large subunit ribosomal protein L23 [Parcubacteria group bacterium Licking1014_1]|nr:MAG: large subunit ribosomal protein L23 [Parcubacteria group bacterium Licking1014_1]